MDAVDVVLLSSCRTRSSFCTVRHLVKSVRVRVFRIRYDLTVGFRVLASELSDRGILRMVFDYDVLLTRL